MRENLCQSETSIELSKPFVRKTLTPNENSITPISNPNEKENESLKRRRENFLRKAKQIHGNRYDYSDSQYIRSNRKIIIGCKTHGKFLQLPNDHLRGCGCPKCAGNCFLYTTDQFIEKARVIHGKEYNYSLVDYMGEDMKVKIICRHHGNFRQTPHSHLRGRGCPVCANNKPIGKVKFIKLAKTIHGTAFDYSMVNYRGNKTPVIIGCKKHGRFNQIPNSHLNGRGCPICNSSKGEIAIHKYLRAIGIRYVYQKSFSDFRNPITNRKLRYDFYIPSKKLLIEYDGTQHFQIGIFHGYRTTKKDLDYTKYKDQLKNRYAKDKKLHLLRIKSLTSVHSSLNNVLK